MGDFWTRVGIVSLFIVIGGVFVAAEIALISLRESQVRKLAERGRRGRRVVELQKNPNRFLAAVQVGVTLAAIVSAGLGASELAPIIEPWMVEKGVSESWAAPVSFILVSVVIAYLTLVFGELVPKRLAIQRAESISLIAAGPVELMARIARPFIAILSVSTDIVIRILGGDPHLGKEQISGEELRGIVASHEELSEEERILIDDVFSAGGRELREIMVPRPSVTFIEASMTIDQAVNEVIDGPHSRFPVIRGSADDVIGFVHVRDLLVPIRDQKRLTVAQVMRPVMILPGTKGILPALTDMRRERQHLAIVADEYGGTAGIVTLEDLVEEVVGDIKDEYDIDPSGFRMVDEVEGLTNLGDFADLAGFELPEGPYETVAGYMIAELGRLPQMWDEVLCDGHRLTVTALDGRRISRISVVRKLEPTPAPDA